MTKAFTVSMAKIIEENGLETVYMPCDPVSYTHLVAAPVFVLLAAVFAVAVPLILIAADVLQEKRRRRVQA